MLLCVVQFWSNWPHCSFWSSSASFTSESRSEKKNKKTTSTCWQYVHETCATGCWLFRSFSKQAENDSDQRWNQKCEDDHISLVKATSRVCPNDFFHVTKPTQAMFTHFICLVLAVVFVVFENLKKKYKQCISLNTLQLSVLQLLPPIPPVPKPFTAVHSRKPRSLGPSRRCWLGLVCSVGWKLGQPARHMRRLLPQYRYLITLETVIKGNQPWHYAECHINSIKLHPQCNTHPPPFPPQHEWEEHTLNTQGFASAV